MQGHEGPLSVSRCKLCASFAASDLPTAAERGLAGSDSFTRNPDICDACLNHDYAARRRWGTLEQWSGLAFGLLITALATFPVLRLYRRELAELLSAIPTFLRLPTEMVLVGIAIAIPSVALCWLLTHVLFWLMARQGKAGLHDPSAQIDAERFRWLAAWAAATGNQRFNRHMVKKAAALGRTDVPQTGDVT